jgi:hypothetical protein
MSTKAPPCENLLGETGFVVRDADGAARARAVPTRPATFGAK